MFLILTVIQILPQEMEIIEEATASSTWFDAKWLKPNNYNSTHNVKIIENSGYLKLANGSGLSDSRVLKEISIALSTWPCR